ncbi:conserved hypothetical protein [Vibrio phage 150E35-1]|nr:conserved hypothetical protein [Vibrio phage 150E35-1]
MIGVEGQYVMVMKLGENEDFLTDDLLHSFETIQKSGGELPSFRMEFSTSDPKIVRAINEGNNLEVRYGRTLDNLQDSTWNIAYPTRSRNGDGRWRIRLTGLLASNGYMTTQSVNIHPGTSSSAISSAASRSGFTYVGNNYASDNMNWIQAGLTDWEFIQQSYVRYYGRGNSAAAIAVCSDGDFRFYDIRKIVTENQRKPIWKLNALSEPLEDNDIVIGNDYIVSPGNGMLNQWAGFGIDIYEHNWTTGEFVIHTNERPSDPIFQSIAAVSKYNRKSEVAHRYLAPTVLTENVHSHWNTAHAINLANLALCSSITVSCSFNYDFYDVKPLDVVQFVDDELRTEDAPDNTNYVDSGVYLVECVGTCYVNRQLSTSLILTRDSVGELSGGVS